MQDVSLAGNGWWLGEGCLTDVQSSQNVYGSFCQTAVISWLRLIERKLNLKRE